MFLKIISYTYMPTHYETLGISKDATEKEIKQAFRAMSMKYHPDKVQNKTPEDQEEANRKMQDINSANDVLSDPQQKQVYDMELNGVTPNQGFPPGFPFGPFGPFGQGQGGPFGQGHTNVHFSTGPFGQGMNFNMQGGPDIFEMLFGGGDPSVLFQKRVPPIEKDITLTLKQAYDGVPMKLEIERIRQQDNVQVKETEVFTINIPQGIDDGETILIKNKGHVISSVCGDVKLNVRVTNETEFTRNGIDLHFKKNITLKEALCGCKFKVDHISGNQIALNVNVVIYTGAKQVIKNFGIIKDGKVGDFIMEFNVTFPETLTQEQKDQLTTIL